jgi:hypothetical protein
MADIAWMIGAMVPAALLLALAYRITKKWPQDYVKSAFLNVFIGLVSVFLHALGAADGGPLNFSNAPLAVFAQTIVFGCDLIRIKGVKSKASSPA